MLKDIIKKQSGRQSNKMIWYFGNTGAGKTAAARQHTGAIVLDGDEMREVWTDLDLTKAGRIEQNRRVARLALNLQKQGFKVVVATICPYRELRREIEELTSCEFRFVAGGKTGIEYPFENDE